MEKALDKCLDEASSAPGVVGVMCCDSKGLCLSSKGNVNISASGLLSELTVLASKLEPETNKSPTVILESDNLNIYVKSVGNITTAIYKSPK